MKYSIVMPHWERAELLQHTLQSFAYHYADRSDWEVIVVEDSKNRDNVRDVIAAFGHLPIMLVRTGLDDGYNPSPAFNAGVRSARGEYLVITNPECLHFTNVLAQLDAEFARHPDAYVVCACESIKGSGDFATPESFTYTHHMWYQHSGHRNECFHFCTALLRRLYATAGGFDDRYADGIAYDDNAFRDRVARAGIPFAVRDDILVLHQWHDKLSQVLPKAEDRRRRERNRVMYEEDCRTLGKPTWVSI